MSYRGHAFVVLPQLNFASAHVVDKFAAAEVASAEGNTAQNNPHPSVTRIAPAPFNRLEPCS